jgi:glycosyltransferase involved in cell wall biosynthesis
MILRKQREQRFIRKNIKLPLPVLQERLALCRTAGPVLSITPTPTGYNWMGVNRATHALFPGSVLELPQYYSQPVYDERELEQLCDAIVTQRFEQIIFSGFPEYYETLAKILHAKKKITGCIYHGFLSELANNPGQSASLQRLMQLAKERTLHKIGFNKKGLAETLQALWDVPCHKIIIKTPEDIFSMTKKSTDGKIHIGVLGNDQFRKNIHNQVAAALLVENAIVHVTGNPQLDHLNPGERTCYHPANQPREDYLKLLGEMDINLHISFSESWGQVTMESLASGVPCLIAEHSDILDYDPSLKSLLTVTEYDNSFAIAEAIKKIIPLRAQIAEQGKAYVQKVNAIAETQLRNFLDA